MTRRSSVWRAPDAAQHPALPVLQQTGYAEQLDRAIAGGLRVLQMPVAPEDLLTELRTLLDARVPAAMA